MQWNNAVVKQHIAPTFFDNIYNQQAYYLQVSTKYKQIVICYVDSTKTVSVNKIKVITQ